MNILEEFNCFQRFKEEILSNKRRAKYYKAFLESIPIFQYINRGGISYCLNHIEDLDRFIRSSLRQKYDEICSMYPYGAEIFVAENDNNHYGPRLTDEDLYEFCLNNIEYIKELNEATVKFKSIYAKHKEAIDIYSTVNQVVDYDQGRVYYPSNDDIIRHDDLFWTEYLESHQTVEKYQKWIENQNAYCNNIVAHSKELLPHWGNYHYFYDITIPWYEGQTCKRFMKIRQLFSSSFCNSEDLDYSLYPSVETKSKQINKILSCDFVFKKQIYEQIINFIEWYGIECIVFADSGQKYHEELNKHHFKSIIEYLDSNRIAHFNIDTFNSDKLITSSFHGSLRCAVLEVVSNNDRLIENCSLITQGLKAQPNSCTLFPNLVYISLTKEYTRDEMIKVLQKKQRRKEQEEKKRQVQIRLQEEQKRKQQEKQRIKTSVIDATANWSTQVLGLKTFSLYNYYPTTCDFEATPDEWDIRNLIWNFKASPIKREPSTVTSIKHKFAVKRIIPILSSCLKKFFGDNTDKITLACVPASTRYHTVQRYKDFSNALCSQLNMVNAFPYINVTSDATPKHEGGTGRANIEIDHNFFKDKLVIMFDDIITKGNTMLRFKSLLEDAGAVVIGGISIGITTHQRTSVNPVDNIDDYCQ